MAQRDRSQLSPKVLRSALRPRSQGKWGWGHLEATKGLQGAFRVSGEAYRRGLTTAAREEPRGLFPVSLAEVGEEGRVEGERSWENRLLCQPPTLKGVPCCEVRERERQWGSLGLALPLLPGVSNRRNVEFQTPEAALAPGNHPGEKGQASKVGPAEEPRIWETLGSL